MIVRLKKPIIGKTDNYAYVCEPDKNHFVYAILQTKGADDLGYMINVWGLNTNNTIYDIPAHYFTIVDKSIPNDWQEGTYEAYGKEITIQSFAEMAEDKYFYDKLMNEDERTVRIFTKYAELYEDMAAK